jgi:hypothetical protein
MVPQSFYYAADKYEERLEGYPFSRRLRVLYHKPEIARKYGFAQFSIETNNQVPLLYGILRAGYALGRPAGTRFFNAPQNNLEIMIYN